MSVLGTPFGPGAYEIRKKERKMKKILNILAVVFVLGTASLFFLGRMAEASCKSEKPQSMQEMCRKKSEQPVSMMEMCIMQKRMMGDEMVACCKQDVGNDSFQSPPVEPAEENDGETLR